MGDNNMSLKELEEEEIAKSEEEQELEQRFHN